MKLLLDTHTFLWWDSDPSQLSPRVLELCYDQNNILILSVISVWEIQIKSQLGKLKLHMPLAELVTSQRDRNNLQLLSAKLDHILAIDSLPFHHKDPFDRLLIAQANIENAVLLSKDRAFSAYSVQVIW